MTNVRQSLHVMAKDLRESRLPLGLFAAITTIATATAVKPGWVEHISDSSIIVLLLPLFGMIVVASFVQGDSPTRADAFWASRPLNPAAVLAAKVTLTLGVVFAIPLMGQLAALLAHHAEADVVRGAMAESAWEYAKWLLIALVVAAVTRDLKSFLVTIAVIPVAAIALILWTFTASQRVTPGSASSATGSAVRTAARHWGSWGLIALGVIGCAALLVYLYRTRDTRPRTWVAAFVVLFLIELTPGPALPRAGIPDSDATVQRTTFAVDMDHLNGYSSGNAAHYALQLTPDSLPPLQRLSILRGIAQFRGNNGNVVTQPLDQARVDMTHTVHALKGLKWLSDRQSNDRIIGTGVVETDSLRSVFDSGLAHLTVDGRVLVRVPGPADTVELRVGSTISRGGTTAVVSNWAFARGKAMLTFRISSLPAEFSGFQSSSTEEDVEFSLVNEARSEAVALSPRGGSSSGGWLVLPGVQISTGEQKFETVESYTRPGIADAPIPDAWFRGACLVISHWVPVGSYPIHVENANPSQPPRRSTSP